MSTVVNGMYRGESKKCFLSNSPSTCSHRPV